MLKYTKIDLDNNLDKCAEFRKDSYIASFPNSDDWMQYWNEEAYRDSLRKHADLFPDGLWHVWLRGELIGQLEFAYKERHGHINLFYLRPEFQGQGYSSNLHEHVIGILRSHDCQTATLRVTPQNTRAMKNYEKHGWEDKGIDSHYDYVHLYFKDL